MVGKNNKKVLIEKQGNKYYRYSIKKLSVGVASVAVGAGIFFGNVSSVSADEGEFTNQVSQETIAIEEFTPIEEPQVDNSTTEEVEASLETSMAPVEDDVNFEEPEETLTQVQEESAPQSEVEETEEAVEESQAPEVEETEEAVEESQAPEVEETEEAVEESQAPEVEETSEIQENEKIEEVKVIQENNKVLRERLNQDKDKFSGLDGKTLNTTFSTTATTQAASIEDLNATYEGTGAVSTNNSIPAYYTVDVVDIGGSLTYKVKYRVDSGGSHDMDLVGFQFGDAFNVPDQIEVNGYFVEREDFDPSVLSSTMRRMYENRTGGFAPITGYLQQGARTGTPAGYALTTPRSKNNFNYVDWVLEFTVPITDREADTTYRGFIPMYLSGDSNHGFDSHWNYFYNQDLITNDNNSGSENPDINFEKEIVREQFEIPYDTVYTLSEDVPYGEEVVIKTGVNGTGERVIQKTSYKGELVGQFELENSVLANPEAEVIALGIGGLRGQDGVDG
ncbi:YSIRK-type signal peptide-containing protein, partial [Aerococcus urinaeequi]|uniref:YSIRK-type signal peptide-containing protein n=1 Tax=Aerococcus urinaeequi TaxID=51665 RepID=UPI003D6B95F1